MKAQGEMLKQKLETPLKEEIRRQGKRKWDGKGNEGKKNWIRVWVFGQKENDKGLLM